MSAAVLTILGDASGVRRALGETVAETRRSVAAIHAESRKASVKERQELSNDAAMKRQLQRQEYQDKVRAITDRRRVEESARKAREKALRDEVKSAESAEKAKIKAAEKTSSTLAKLAQKGAKDAEKAEQAKLKAAEKAERERTRLAEAEARKRARDANRARAEELRAARESERRMARAAREADRGRRERGGRYGNALGAVVDAAGSGARSLDGQIQSARQSRAGADRSLGQAVRNAGGSEANVAATRDRVRRFVTDTGMSYADVAEALATGQERGSSLEAGPDRTREQAMEESLDLIREANAEGANPGQYLAARGRLAATGLRGDSLRSAMRFALGAAQSGQVEVDQLLQQGLPGATQLMESRVSALGPGATDAQRQAARLGAWRESVATQEVLAASGGASRQTSNTLAGLQNFMNTPRRQEGMLTNLRTAAGQVNTSTPEGQARAAALRALYEGDNALYERDPTRRGNAMRLRAGVSPIELATRVAAATGGNAQMGANIFAGGGHGNPQALLANMRNLFAVLGSERGQRIQQMMAGGGLSGEVIAAHQAAVESDELARLTRAQEAGANALTDNTNAIVRLSGQLADRGAANPFQKQAAESGLDAASGAANALTNGGLTMMAGRGLANTTVGRRVAGVGARLLAPAGAALGRLGGGMLGTVGGGLLRATLGAPGAIAGLLLGEGTYGGLSQDVVQQQQQGGAEYERQAQRLTAQAQATGRPPPTADEIGAAVALHLSRTPITATVAPGAPTTAPTPAPQ